MERDFGYEVLTAKITVRGDPRELDEALEADCAFCVARPHKFLAAGTKMSMPTVFSGNYSGLLVFHSIIHTDSCARTHHTCKCLLQTFNLCHLVKCWPYLSHPLTSLVSQQVTITKGQWPTQNPDPLPLPLKHMVRYHLGMEILCPRGTWLYI